MAIIRTKKGQEILISDEDYEVISRYSWYIENDGYARSSQMVNGKRKSLSMHRLIANPGEGLFVDHRNRVRHDNRRGNLRVCTRAQNAGNRTSSKGSTSRYKGVSRNVQRGNWQAKITKDNIVTHIGLFSTEVEAGRAYNIEAKRHFGEFACLNITNPEYPMAISSAGA